MVIVTVSSLLVCVMLFACGGDKSDTTTSESGSQSAAKSSSEITIDGSSTVFPVNVSLTANVQSGCDKRVFHCATRSFTCYIMRDERLKSDSDRTKTLFNSDSDRFILACGRDVFCMW